MNNLTGIEALRQDKRFLELEILKLVQTFENKYSAEVYKISSTYSRNMGEKVSRTVGISVDIKI